MRYLSTVAQLCVDPTGSIPDPSLPTISVGPPIRTSAAALGRSRTTVCLGVCSTTHLRDPAGQTTCQVKIARRRTHDDQERRHVLAGKRSTSALTSRPIIALLSRRSDCPETPAPGRYSHMRSSGRRQRDAARRADSVASLARAFLPSAHAR
jgi:hypothetical protein